MPRPPFFYRLRRTLRHWLKSAPGAVDGFTPAGGLVLVVAPHPDDEVIGCGGTLRRHVLAGDSAAVVYLTRGEASRGFPWLSGEERQQVRMAEARAGCRLLGVTDLVFLNGKDGGCGEPGVMADLSRQMLELIRQRRPRRVYVPHATDSHADHRAANRIVREVTSSPASAGEPACNVVEYEVWSPMRAEFAVDVSGQAALKLKALRCHRAALDAFDYIPTVQGLSRYRSGTLLQKTGYAEAFGRGGAAAPPIA